MNLRISTELYGFDNFENKHVELPDGITGAVFALWFMNEFGLSSRHMDVLHDGRDRVGAWDLLKDLKEPRVLLVRDHRNDTWWEWFWKML